MVPLLLPQGVCVCDFVAAPPAHVTPDEQQTEPETSACACHKHQRNHAEDPVCPSSDQVRHSEHSLPTNEQDNHIPGCPAKVAGGLWKVKSADPPSLVGSFVVGFLVASVGPTLKPGFPERSPGFTSLDHPLYLTLLTLRI
jgi:hypothetical protein